MPRLSACPAAPKSAGLPARPHARPRRLPAIHPVLLALAALVACAPLSAQPLPAGPKVKVTAVTQLSSALPQFTRVEIPMLREDVPKTSGGRVEFDLKSMTDMNIQGPEMIRLVRSGQVDVGAGPLTTVSGDVPLLDAIDLPGANASMEQLYTVSKAVMPSVNKELERVGVKIIATSPFPAQVFFCRKPVASIADLNALKIRVAGPAQSDFIKALGAQPVSIAFAEAYSALERGAVDCAVTGTGSGAAQKWPEVTTHLYTLVASWGISGYFVNLAWWNKLDAPVRAYLETTFTQVQDAQWKLGLEMTQDGIECNVGNSAGCKIFSVAKKPMVLNKPSAADVARARQVLNEVVLPSWVKRCGDRCGLLYNEVIAPINGVSYVAR